jgi:cyclophilin family peptidyl-prolyl cis-trans isomerase
MKRTLSVLAALFIGLFAQAQNKVVIETEYGNIVFALYDNTPQHRDNMVKLVKEHFFDSTLFHRVIPNFVIQGGDPASKTAVPGQMLGEGELGYLVPAEINDSCFHQRGAVGMARDDNPAKSSSACQFYIVTGRTYTAEELTAVENRKGIQLSPAHKQVYMTSGGTPQLDGNYTVFGIVEEGMDIVDKISNEPRNNADRPDKDIKMIRVYMKEEQKPAKKELKESKKKEKGKD